MQTQTHSTSLSLATSATSSSYFITKTGIVNTTRLILREEGVRGLYKGLTTNLIRTIPSAAISLWTYEIIVSQLAPSN